MEDITGVPLEVPRNFRLICELFGIAAPAFIQLFLDHYSFIDQNFTDNSSYNIATRAVRYVNDKIPKVDNPLKIEFEKNEKEMVVKLLRRQVKLAINRNYSTGERRNKGRMITAQIYDFFATKVRLKDRIYLNENISFKLSKGFLLTCLINGVHPAHYINTMMQQVSTPDFLATMHLDKATYNPVLGLIHRVHDGYGDLIDWEYRHTPFFKRFIMDLQELNKRYFFYRDLDKRIALYEAWLDRILESKDEEFEL
ncbi:hypothetical protein [Sphingobacterium sp. UBA5996]|uniref:hypothetical protein n=1 Tax=Sphingobacterium sp. UBA5996 TaxID=1947505 RepID=UPI0025DDC59E|nr:hypothetical protein [Sphingobacterium sp. UBA5996]